MPFRLKTHKYGAVRTAIDGVTFASKKEAARYRELKLLQLAGEITGLVLQPQYNIYVRPMVGPGELVKVAAYVGDFQYYDKQGCKIIEDTKSPATRVNRLYRLKKKLVEVLYDITISEV